MRTNKEKYIKRLTKTLDKSKDYVEFERRVIMSPRWHLDGEFKLWTKKELKQFYQLVKGE